MAQFMGMHRSMPSTNEVSGLIVEPQCMSSPEGAPKRTMIRSLSSFSILRVHALIHGTPSDRNVSCWPITTSWRRDGAAQSERRVVSVAIVTNIAAVPSSGA